MEYAYNVYEDSYNVAVNQWLDRKAIGSKRRKETFRVTGKNASTSTRPLLAGRISARMLKRCFWISPRATIFPIHICMISLKNIGLPVIPVRIANLRY